jgi:hypothetical protein
LHAPWYVASERFYLSNICHTQGKQRWAGQSVARAMEGQKHYHTEIIRIRLKRKIDPSSCSVVLLLLLLPLLLLTLLLMLLL